VVLVATVGTGRERSDIADAIAFSFRRNGAGKLLMLCSRKSRAETVPEVEKLLAGADRRVDVCPAGLEDDVQGLFLYWQRRWEELLAGWLPAGRVVVDFTSGTKPMSAAAFALAIARGAAAVSYVVGPRDQTGRVTVSTDVVSFAPELVVAHQQLRLAAEHFNAGSYASARDIAGRYLKADDMPDEHLRALARSVHYIAAAYAAWDRFDWKQAQSRFHQVAGEWDRWGWVDSPGLLEANYGFVREAEKARKAGGWSVVMLADLLGSAQRCMDRADWDDAAVRLYRACEMLAQLALKQQGLMDGTRVMVDRLAGRLPAGELDGLKARADERGKVRLGLRDSYRLLGQLGHPLAEEFFRLYGRDAHGPLANAVSARNGSLLGHGVVPIGQDKAEELRGHVLALAENFCGQELGGYLEAVRPVRFEVA